MLKKHTILHLSIIFLICLIFLFPILKGFYQSHDSVTHVARTAAYAKAFTSGQFPPRWAADLNYGFGSPFLIFYYPLPGYIMATMHFLGIPLEMTYRLLAGLLFIGGPFSFYFWTKQKFSPYVALLSTIFYLCLPYRFLTLYVRGGIGEFMAFSLLPLLFYLFEKEKNKQVAILSIGFISGLLILSHNAISLFFIPIFLMYSLLNGKKQLATASCGIFLGLLFSAFFWLPALLEAKYTSPLFYFKNWYLDHFVLLPSLIYSLWGFGADINKPGGLSAQLGLIGTIVLITSTALLFFKKQKNERKFFIFWIIVACSGLFLSTTLSSFLWLKIDFLKKFQFPWRFMVLPAFATAALSPYVFSSIKKNWLLIFFAIVCLFLTFPFIRVSQYITHSDSFYYLYPGSTYYHGEATTPWTEGDPGHKALSQFEIINGDNVILNPIKQSTFHSVTTNSTLPVTLVDNTVYFPGWIAYVDNREVPIQFQDINYKGFIEIAIPEGKHTVIIRFEETKIRKIADYISLVSMICILLFSVYATHRAYTTPKTKKKHTKMSSFKGI